jgi:ubiquitin-like protein ATG12
MSSTETDTTQQKEMHERESSEKKLDSTSKTENNNDTLENKLATNLEHVSLETGDEQSKVDADSSSNVGDSSLASTTAANAGNKVEILLKAAGNAPILKKKKFLLERSKNVHYVIEWLKKYMRLNTNDQLFLYVNQDFAPSPDAEIGTLYDCFKTGNNIILYYCTTPAWG